MSPAVDWRTTWPGSFLPRARCGSTGRPGSRRRSSGSFSVSESISEPDLEATFNMGVGMVAVLPSDVVDAAVRLLAGRGCGPGCVDRSCPPGGQRERVRLFGQHVVADSGPGALHPSGPLGSLSLTTLTILSRG